MAHSCRRAVKTGRVPVRRVRRVTISQARGRGGHLACFAKAEPSRMVISPVATIVITKIQKVPGTTNHFLSMAARSMNTLNCTVAVLSPTYSRRRIAVQIPHFATRRLKALKPVKTTNARNGPFRIRSGLHAERWIQYRLQIQAPMELAQGDLLT